VHSSLPASGGRSQLNAYRHGTRTPPLLALALHSRA